MFVCDVNPRIVVLGGNDRKRSKLGKALDFGTVVLATDQALAGIDGAFRVGNRLALCDLAYEFFTGPGVGHHGGSGARTFGVRDDLDRSCCHD